jgi:hypothetical protein
MPGEVRPARPARWVAEATEVGTVTKEARPVVGLNTRIFTKQLSTTNLMPSMVTLASAILVETMTLRMPGSAGSNTASCSSVERPAWSGRRAIRGEERGILGSISASSSKQRSMSSRPVRNIRISPGPCCKGQKMAVIGNT